MMHNHNNYTLSTDFKQLFNRLMRGEIIAAFIDYTIVGSDRTMRDICKLRLRGDEIEATTRGVCYLGVSEFDVELRKKNSLEELFIDDCSRLNIEWIVPEQLTSTDSEPRTAVEQHSPLMLIDSLRATDNYIEVIYTQGGCFKFHTFLLKFFPSGRPWISKNKDHIVTEIDGKLYDITGEVNLDDYTLCNDDDLLLAKTWSFSRNRLLSLGECSNCDEPIVV